LHRAALHVPDGAPCIAAPADPPGPWTPGPRPIRYFTEFDRPPGALRTIVNAADPDEVLIETQKAAEPHLRIHAIWRMNEPT